MKSWLLFGAALLGIVLTTTSRAEACSCAGMDPPEAFNRADMVFRGEVLGVEPSWTRRLPLARRLRSWLGGGDVAIVFRVDGSWKGVDDSQVTVWTDESSCGIHPPVGSVMLVYATVYEGLPYVGQCMRTQWITSTTEDLVYLGPPQVNLAPPPGTAWRYAMGATGMLVVMSALLWAWFNWKPQRQPKQGRS